MDSTIAGRMVFGLARTVAVAGGIALLVLVAIVVISVIGRALIPFGLAPIPGDYELVEAATGFAIFAFLPWVHLTRGHAVVTIFTDNLGPKFTSWIVVVTDALMLTVSVFLAWRHLLGTIDKYNYGETTLLLRMPLWWSYASGLVGAFCFVVVGAYVLVRSINEATTGRPAQPIQGVIH